MLYDPKWDRGAVKDGGALLDRWIDWLETKDPDEAYQWRYAEGCACGQFYGGAGWVGNAEFSLLNSIARGDRGRSYESDWTFGKCLARAKYWRDLKLGA